MKAQISVEYFIVLGIGIALLSTYLLSSYDTLYSNQVTNEISMTKESLEKIAKTADFVAMQGTPAKQKISVCFPVSIKNCTIEGKTLDCSLFNGRQVYYDSKVNLTGQLPSGGGCYYLSIKAEENIQSETYINITLTTN